MRLFAELFSGRISSAAEGKDCRPPTRRGNLSIEAQRMVVHWRNEKICLPVGTQYVAADASTTRHLSTFKHKLMQHDCS